MILKGARIGKREGPSRFSFRGRANRRQYFGQIIWAVFTGAVLVWNPILAALYAVFATIVILAVTSRRLHDLSWSGWLQLTPMLPLVLGLILAPSMAETTEPARTGGTILQGYSSNDVIYGVLFLPMLIFQIWLLAAPGVDGPNVYGEGSTFE